MVRELLLLIYELQLLKDDLVVCFYNFFLRYEMTYKFRENGYSVDYLVDFSVTTDLKNSR